MKKILFFILLFNVYYTLPVATIHGFYDSCSNPFFTTLVKLLKYNVQDYSVCLETGEGSDSLSLSFEEQCENACEKIKSNEKFQNDFSILSISQGGLIARYIIQKCNMKGKVKNLVSFGGPMMGTSQVPYCLGGVSCYIINSLVDYFVYFKYYQNNIGPAGYYRTAAHEDDFKKSESFLAKLNNPRSEEKKRFTELNHLVLIGFKKDKMISPKESAEFGIFDKKFNVKYMNQTDEYELIGLKELYESGKIQIIYLEGEHIDFDYDDVKKYAIPNL